MDEKNLNTNEITSDNELPYIEGMLEDAYIGNIEDVHEYHADNEFILKGYRIHFLTVPRILKSLFMVHNESFNIWSHLLGFLTAVFLLIFSLITLHKYRLLYKNEVESSKFNEMIDISVQLHNEYFDKKTNVLNINSYDGTSYTLVSEDHDSMVSYSNKINDYNLSDLNDDISDIYNFALNNKILCLSCIDDAQSLLEKLDTNIIQYVNKYIKESRSSVYFDGTCKADTFSRANNFTCVCNDFESKLYNFIKDEKDKNKQLAQYASDNQDNSRVLARWPLVVFFIGGMFCLGFSAIFHLFSAHDKTVKRIFNRLDYAGISLLIVGSCYPPYYYYFYCNFNYAIGYLSFMTIFGLVIFGVSLSNHFDKPEYLKLKGGLFLLLGISAGIALVHIDQFPDSIGTFEGKLSIRNYYIGGLCYIVGAVIYILRVPERFKPGIFDYIGNSHNIFHLFVLAGFGLHYEGGIKSYNYRLNYSC